MSASLAGSPTHRRPLALLVLFTAAVASIATSPAPTLDARVEFGDILLSATRPTFSRRVRVVLRPKGGVDRQRAQGFLTVSFVMRGSGPLADGGVPTDAGGLDAGAGDAGTFDAGASDAGTFDAGANDAGTNDAGMSPPPRAVLVQFYREGASPPASQPLEFRDTFTSQTVSSDLFPEPCTATECVAEFNLNLDLPRAEQDRALLLTMHAEVQTSLDPDDGTLTVEFIE